MNALESRGLSKPEWRAKLKFHLSATLKGAPKTQWDQSIQKFVRDILPPQGGYVAAYIARHDEPEIFHDLSKHDPQWRWVFPRIEDHILKFYNPQSPDAFVTGKFGIQEPDPARSTHVPLKECAVVLVPGLGFDRRGTRLGRGLGHFDRALQEYTGSRVGVAYSCQVVNENFVRESHDVPMDMIVTEKYLLRVKG